MFCIILAKLRRKNFSLGENKQERGKLRKWKRTMYGVKILYFIFRNCQGDIFELSQLLWKEAVIMCILYAALLAYKKEHVPLILNFLKNYVFILSNCLSINWFHQIFKLLKFPSYMRYLEIKILRIEFCCCCCLICLHV